MARKRDCIMLFRDRVLSDGILKVSDFEAIDVENQRLIQDAVSFAESSPLPELTELYSDVYTQDLSLA